LQSLRKQTTVAGDDGWKRESSYTVGENVVNKLDYCGNQFEGSSKT
jgi:hypothetical protein